MGKRKEETEKISQRKGTGRTQRNLLRQINSHREKNIRPGYFYKERARSYTMETREKKIQISQRGARKTTAGLSMEWIEQ